MYVPIVKMQPSINDKQPEEVIVYVCSICRTNFDDNAAIVSHMISSHKDNEHVQQICEDASRSRFKVKKKMTRLYKKQLQCNLCAYSTVHMTTLKRHIKLHNKNNEVQHCPYCSFKTVQSNNLKLHLKNIHPDGEPDTFVIDVEPGNIVHALLEKYL